MYPAGVISLAVGALGGFLIAALLVRAGVVMDADVLGCGMGARTTTAAVHHGALRRPVPPVLAPKALQWSGNIDTNATHNPSDSEVVVYGCISCIF